MSAKPEIALSTVLLQRWEQASSKLTDLADAVPVGKFESAPVAGIRTPAQVLRHVAFWNRYLAATLRGEQASDADNELPAAECPDKASVVNALRQSMAEVSSALRRAVNAKDAEAVISFIEHTSEHYGQMVVYARIMGIVPPASR